MPDSKPKKILIAEDEVSLAKALTLKLGTLGFTVDTAGDGAEALQKIQSTVYDLVLLDIIMPGMDGFGLLKALKGLKNPPKVIVSSNLGQEEDKKKALELGAADYYVKSDTSLAQIVDKIKVVMQ